MAFINKQIYSLPEDFQTDLKLIMEFVERWNKQDKESDIAAAAGRIEYILNECAAELAQRNEEVKELIRNQNNLHENQF